MKIGIIGLGVVGSTIYTGLEKFHEIKGYDIDSKRSKNSFKEIIDTEVIFLALPTPLKDGRLDCSLIMEYLKKLEKNNFSGLIVIKSTLHIGFMEKARELNLRIGYSPEFLHVKNALNDFLNPTFVLFSGNLEDYILFIQIFWDSIISKIHRVDDKVAELTKLVMNSFAATKISFINEIERICLIHGVNAFDVLWFLRTDKRCASEYSYTKGHFEGRCLPKDLQELINSTEDTFLLEAVHKVNERKKDEK